MISDGHETGAMARGRGRGGGRACDVTWSPLHSQTAAVSATRNECGWCSTEWYSVCVALKHSREWEWG